ncbi:MAG: hypothetical protein ACREVC_05040 [Burkholderiales bacterium]
MQFANPGFLSGWSPPTKSKSSGGKIRAFLALRSRSLAPGRCNFLRRLNPFRLEVAMFEDLPVAVPVSSEIPVVRLCQWRDRVTERLLVWESVGAKVRWMNLTTAPGGDGEALWRHWAELRSLMVDRLGVPIEWVGARTREGHGVLHVLAAAQCLPKRSWSEFCKYDWVSESWSRIHGAIDTHVTAFDFEPSRLRPSPVFGVSQYMTFSQRPKGWDFKASRRSFTSAPDRSLFGELRRLVVPEWRVRNVDGEEVVRLSPRIRVLRKAWRSLLRSGQCEVDGSVLVRVREGGKNFLRPL